MATAHSKPEDTRGHTRASDDISPEKSQVLQELRQFQVQLRQAHPGIEYEDSVEILDRTRQEHDNQ
jgi:hypothetical protein